MNIYRQHKNIFGRLRDAFRGVDIYFREELNSRYKFFLFLILPLILLLIFINPSFLEFLIVLLAIGFGIALGFVNIIVEKLCDLYSLENNNLIRDIKDLAAGACVIYMIVFISVLVLIYIN